MLMENVQAFQAAIKKYGVPDMEIFQTADLLEEPLPKGDYEEVLKVWVTQGTCDYNPTTNQ